MRNINVSDWVENPHQLINISWIVDGSSGNTQCEAWRGQYEIDQLEKAGYTVLNVSKPYWGF